MVERRAKSALEKMLDEAKRREEKERILADVQRLYSKFGDEVVLIILDYVFREHGLATLLKKLDIVPALKREEQLQMLFHYLKRYGAKHFIELVSHSRKITFQHKVATQPTSPDEQAVQDSQAESPPTTGLPAVERRSGKERRSEKDRRQRVEMVFRNRRFGGERRSGVDRRKDWHSTS